MMPPLTSARSGNIFGNGQVLVMRTVEGSADPICRLVSRQQRYDRKLWIEDFVRDVVYLPFEQSNGSADVPASAGRVHRGTGYTTTKLLVGRSCSTSTRSPAREPKRCSLPLSKPRYKPTSKWPKPIATKKGGLWPSATVMPRVARSCAGLARSR